MKVELYVRRNVSDTLVEMLMEEHGYYYGRPHGYRAVYVKDFDLLAELGADWLAKTSRIYPEGAQFRLGWNQSPWDKMGFWYTQGGNALIVAPDRVIYIGRRHGFKQEWKEVIREGLLDVVRLESERPDWPWYTTADDYPH